MTRYYGFEQATTDGYPAWFHHPQSALNFAAYCWGRTVSEPDATAAGGWIDRDRTEDDLDETTEPQEEFIFDSPDGVWTAENQSPEWREDAQWNEYRYITSLWHSQDGNTWLRRSDDGVPGGPFGRATLTLKGGPSDGQVVS